MITHVGFWENMRKVCKSRLVKLVNHEPKASHGDLQTFLMFSQHPAWVITLVNQLKVRSVAFIKCINYKMFQFSMGLPVQ